MLDEFNRIGRYFFTVFCSLTKCKEKGIDGRFGAINLLPSKLHVITAVSALSGGTAPLKECKSPGINSSRTLTVHLNDMRKVRREKVTLFGLAVLLFMSLV